MEVDVNYIGDVGYTLCAPNSALMALQISILIGFWESSNLSSNDG